MTLYLFILSPPFSGSTALWELLKTSSNISSLSTEGQLQQNLKDIMRENSWDPQKEYPWDFIKEKWLQKWDDSKPIYLEKSPPNIIRAFEIEQVFSPCYFITMIRNPYAFCEGYSRRQNFQAKNLGARFWIKCAEFQKKNILGLDKIISFSYEDFTDRTQEVATKLLQFIPQLETINIESNFNLTSVEGKLNRKIVNLNHTKISKLSSEDISDINSVLLSYPELMDFFGYEYLTG